MNFSEFEARFKKIDNKIALKTLKINELYDNDVAKIEERFKPDVNSNTFVQNLNGEREVMLKQITKQRDAHLKQISEYFEQLVPNIPRNFKNLMSEKKSRIFAGFAKFTPRKLTNFECILKTWNLTKPFNLAKVDKYSKLLLNKKRFKINLPAGYKLEEANHLNKFLTLPSRKYFIYAKKGDMHRIMITDKDGNILKSVEKEEKDRFKSFDICSSYIICRARTSVSSRFTSFIVIYDYNLNIITAFQEKKAYRFFVHNDEVYYHTFPDFGESICFYNMENKLLKETEFNNGSSKRPFYVNEDDEECNIIQFFDRYVFTNYSKNQIFLIDSNTGKRLPNVIKIGSGNLNKYPEDTEELSSDIPLHTDKFSNVYLFDKPRKILKAYNSNFEFLYELPIAEKYKCLKWTPFDSCVFGEKLAKDNFMEYEEY